MTITELEAVKVERDALQAELQRLYADVGDVLSASGCSCDCEHHYEEHDADCDRCLGCRIEAVMVRQP
jgi:hypothetical protein